MKIQMGKAHVRITLVDPEGSTLLNVQLFITNEEWEEYHLHALPPDTEPDFNDKRWREGAIKRTKRAKFVYEVSDRIKKHLARAFASQDKPSQADMQAATLVTTLLKGTADESYQNDNL